MDRDAFFAQLDQLTPKEIEARLSSYDKERLGLVLEYFAQRDRGKSQQADNRPLAAWENVVTERTIAAALIALGAVLAALILRGGYEVNASNVGAYVVNRFTGATWQCLDTCVRLETTTPQKK